MDGQKLAKVGVSSMGKKKKTPGISGKLPAGFTKGMPVATPRKGTKMTPKAVAMRKKSKISNAASKVMGGLTSK